MARRNYNVSDCLRLVRAALKFLYFAANINMKMHITKKKKKIQTNDRILPILVEFIWQQMKCVGKSSLNCTPSCFVHELRRDEKTSLTCTRWTQHGPSWAYRHSCPPTHHHHWWLTHNYHFLMRQVSYQVSAQRLCNHFKSWVFCFICLDRVSWTQPGLKLAI